MNWKGRIFKMFRYTMPVIFFAFIVWAVLYGPHHLGWLAIVIGVPILALWVIAWIPILFPRKFGKHL